jgi:hypothetical protein
MVADWSHLFPLTLGPRPGAGVLKAIKGNIWASAVFVAAVVFSPQMRGSKWGARDILLGRMACSFGGQAFTKRHQHIIYPQQQISL